MVDKMIRNLFNLITAWTSVVLLIMVIIIWILRVLVQKKIVSKESFIFKANRTLRKYHKITGVAFLIIALIHGLLSSANVISLNMGSICFFFILIMSLSYIIKSRLSRKLWLNIHRVLTIMVALTFAIHLKEVGIQGLDLLSKPATLEEYLLQQQIDDLNNEVNVANRTTDNSISYLDGVYTGVADGYGPDLTVDVTIYDNLIKEVKVVSHNEVNERFWEIPIEYIPEAIVQTQSVEVDSISGATYTSVGVKNAVIDALSKAIVSGELPQIEDLPTNGHRHGPGRGH